jgi:hypothetical protein
MSRSTIFVCMMDEEHAVVAVMISMLNKVFKVWHVGQRKSSKNCTCISRHYHFQHLEYPSKPKRRSMPSRELNSQDKMSMCRRKGSPGCVQYDQSWPCHSEAVRLDCSDQCDVRPET